MLSIRTFTCLHFSGDHWKRHFNNQSNDRIEESQADGCVIASHCTFTEISVAGVFGDAIGLNVTDASILDCRLAHWAITDVQAVQSGGAIASNSQFSVCVENPDLGNGVIAARPSNSESGKSMTVVGWTFSGNKNDAADYADNILDILREQNQNRFRTVGDSSHFCIGGLGLTGQTNP
jgi:hypothetical protein